MKKVKNILTITAVIAVIVSAIILIMMVLGIGDNVQMQEDLLKSLKIIGVIAATSMIIVGILNLSDKK